MSLGEGAGGIPAEPPRPPRKVWAKSAGAVAVAGGELSTAAEESGAGAHPAQSLTVPPAASFRRAEEEDEHLERTLEQNKGKMAKKEEKCVLQ